MELKLKYLEEARKMGLDIEQMAIFTTKLDRMLEVSVNPDELEFDPQMLKVLLKLSENIPPEERDRRRHEGQRRTMEKCHRETGSWHEVYTTVVYDDTEYAGIFMDLLQEVLGEKIATPEDLERLTDIRMGTTDSREGLLQTIVDARYWKYSQALDGCLAGGGKYPELLKVEPEDFGLPQEWPRWKDEKWNKEKAIIWAVGMWANLGESSHALPDLHAVARALNAPYRVVFEARKTLSVNHWG